MPSPAPETSGLKPENVWELDLPPLADVQGKTSLDRARLPEHLAPIPDRIFEGVTAGKRLFILLRHGQPAKVSGHDQKLIWQTHADLFQLVHRGLRSDERLQGFPVFCPDDREDDHTSEQVKTQYQSLAQAARHIEEQSADPAQAFLNWLKTERKLEEDPRGALVVLTPEVAAAIGKQEALYLFSKLKRLFVEKGQADIIEVPAAPENLYVGWEKHVQGARVDEIRRLLEAAMAHPLPADGVPERVTRFPASLETQEGQEPAVRTILREMQRMFIAPSHLLLHGQAGVGKTTLLAGMYQLARQLGLGAHYTSWDRAKAEELGKELVEKEFLVDRNKASKDPDQLLCVDQADVGSEKKDETLSRFMSDVKRKDGDRTISPEIVLRARIKRLALRACLMMTSNLTVAQLRQNVERALSGYVTGDYYCPSTHPLPTLAYLLGDHLRTPSAPEKPQVPDTYSGFIGRLHTVELGGRDWGTLKSGGVDWGI